MRGKSTEQLKLMEVAELRHVFSGDMAVIREGYPLKLRVDAQNPVDSDALAAFHQDRKIGYVNRAMLPQFHAWPRHPGAASLRAAYRARILDFALNSMVLEGELVDQEQVRALLNRPVR